MSNQYGSDWEDSPFSLPPASRQEAQAQAREFVSIQIEDDDEIVYRRPMDRVILEDYTGFSKQEKTAAVAFKNAFDNLVDTIWKGKSKRREYRNDYETFAQNTREGGLESKINGALAKVCNALASFIEVVAKGLGIAEKAADTVEKIRASADAYQEKADRVYEKSSENGKWAKSVDKKRGGQYTGDRFSF